MAGLFRSVNTRYLLPSMRRPKWTTTSPQKITSTTMLQTRTKSDAYPAPETTEVPKGIHSKPLRVTGQHLHIPTWSPGHNPEIEISALWLRDHCRCSMCYNYSTNQRASHILSFKNTAIIASASVDTSTNAHISITWIDGHQSKYSLDWIKGNWCHPPSERLKPILWSAEKMSNQGLPSVAYEEIVGKKEDGLKRLLENVAIYGVGTIRDVPATFEETNRLCALIALPEETIYGKFWKFSAESMDHADTAYTNIALGAHTDLTYYSQTAGMQVFHLLEHSGGQGGNTLLVDGFNAAEQLRSKDPQAFQFLSTKPIPCHFLDRGAHYFSEEPVIDVNPLTNQIKQIRFNVYDRSTLNNFHSDKDVEEFYRSYMALAEIIASRHNEFWIGLEPGTVLFIDNFRVLHGRSAFTGKRVICGCYLQRDNFMSKIRAL